MRTTTVGIVFCMYGCLWVACQSDAGAEKVQEIRTGGPNSDLVRNPINADGTIDSSLLARITFEETEFDFGSVNEGEVVEHRYKFTNTGKVPLLVQNARSSCGCTIPEWPEEPLEPGESGEIVAKFNTEGRPGAQKKMIYVSANTLPAETSILLKGEVKGRD